MTRMQPEDQEDTSDDFQPLTAEQARELRKRQPLLSVWRVVLAQALIGTLLSMVAWLVTARVAAVYSVAYGALAVVLPAKLAS